MFTPIFSILSSLLSALRSPLSLTLHSSLSTLMHSPRFALIEYDGKQHFEYNPLWSDGGQAKFEVCQLHDRMKNCFVREYHLHLLRVSFLEAQSISEWLDRFIVAVSGTPSDREVPLFSNAGLYAALYGNEKA